MEKVTDIGTRRRAHKNTRRRLDETAEHLNGAIRALQRAGSYPVEIALLSRARELLSHKYERLTRGDVPVRD